MVGLFPERREKAGGWPKVLTVIEVQILRNMALDKSLTVADTCKTLGISRRTFYRYLRPCLVRVRAKPFWRSLAYAEDPSEGSLFARNASKTRRSRRAKTPHVRLFDV
jgi:predicted DNA-binding protein (UPF0251 family)